MAYDTILFDVSERVATITLNRPERMNAFIWRLGSELADALDVCDRDDEIRAVVLTGAGNAFCAGADMGGGEETFSADGLGEPSERRPLRPFLVRKPVIAAINGHAIGVGLTMTMLCDLRYVAEDAKLAFAFVRRGIIPELASHVIVPRIAGFSNAADLMLSGRTFSGHEAAERGLASKALPREEVLPAALEFARDLALNTAPVSVAIAKRLLWEGLTDSPRDMMRKEDRLFDWAGEQPDAAEGVMSFVKKREPRWKLRVSSDMPDWPTSG